MQSKPSSIVKKRKSKSANTEIVKSRIQEYINQVREENNSIDDKLQIIQDQITMREEYLTDLINNFEEFIEEYEVDHPKQSEWHKTIKNARKLLLIRK